MAELRTKLLLAGALLMVLVLLWGAVGNAAAPPTDEELARLLAEGSIREQEKAGEAVPPPSLPLKRLADAISATESPSPSLPAAAPPKKARPAPQFKGGRANKAQRMQAAKSEALHTRRAAKEAIKKQAKKGPAWSPLGKVGIVLHAYGEEKYIEQALAVVRNVKAVMPEIESFTVWASARNRGFLENIAQTKTFIVPRFYEDIEIPRVVASCDKFLAPPPALAARIAGTAASDYDTTVLLASQTHVCDRFTHLLPTKKRNYDVAAAAAAFARWGGTRGHDHYLNATLPNNPALRDEWSSFMERNTGVLFLRTSNPAVRHLLSDWLDIFVSQVNTTEKCALYNHDQPAWREALFKKREVLSERLLPPEKICREGNMVSGCQLKKGCATDGCDLVHCKVSPRFAHKSRVEIRGKK